ncbi:hypothetical protein D9758_007018 [Tetrapyrgos nigripes]|uniref:Uncharacterized protein n=1 Tax=Tetrapyrgos nigripes TaxID=182062 RepID=A0A8H5GDD1_9AGAR|nr:hypothetical protein D9758_007018 [Tetrapyrgos nigripes]
MDSDRKSTVSSFYGRKGSMDALNNDFPSPAPNSNPYSTSNQHQRGGVADDASSFFGANPNPNARPAGAAASAGYNRNSFFFAGREEPLKGGRDEEEDGFRRESAYGTGAGGYGAGPGEPVGGGGDPGFDIYADFNNAGPKYSSAYTSSNGYQALNGPSSPTPNTASLSKTDLSNPSTPGTELVTVPALGPEWRKDEMRDMTKTAKRARRYESRREAWKAWNRGERGICGRWFTKKMLVIVVFVVCVIVGIILAFTIPRVPSFFLNSDSPFANASTISSDFASSIPIHFERLPANFSFPAYADMEINTDSNYLPLHFNKLSGSVFDSETGKMVATGDMSIDGGGQGYTIPAKETTRVVLPLNFTYLATNFTDPTWVNWHDACQNAGAVQGGVRPGLNFRFVLEMHIAGLIGKRTASTQVTNAACPVELPLSAG